MLLGAEISGAEPLKIHVVKCKKIQRRPPRKPCKCAVFYTTNDKDFAEYLVSLCGQHHEILRNMKRTESSRHYVNNVGRTRRKRTGSDDVLVIPDEYPSAASTGWIL